MSTPSTGQPPGAVVLAHTGRLDGLRPPTQRRLVSEMLAEVELSDLRARTDAELSAAMGRLVRYEQQVSRRRQRLQRTADECGAEITRRYRDGEAQVDDLLS